MVIVSAVANVFFSLIIIIITVVELFFIHIGILDVVGIFLMGILNIMYISNLMKIKPHTQSKNISIKKNIKILKH